LSKGSPNINCAFEGHTLQTLVALATSCTLSVLPSTEAWHSGERSAGIGLAPVSLGSESVRFPFALLMGVLLCFSGVKPISICSFDGRAAVFVRGEADCSPSIEPSSTSCKIGRRLWAAPVWLGSSSDSMVTSGSGEFASVIVAGAGSGTSGASALVS
jgi:hypothetical protein